MDSTQQLFLEWVHCAGHTEGLRHGGHKTSFLKQAPCVKEKETNLNPKKKAVKIPGVAQSTRRGPRRGQFILAEGAWDTEGGSEDEPWEATVFPRD